MLIDSGAQYLGGTTDITRVWAIGTPTAAQKHDYTLVLKGTLGADKARLLAQVRAAIAQPESAPLRPAWLRGL